MEPLPNAENVGTLTDRDVNVQHSALSDSDGRLYGIRISSSGEDSSSVSDFDVLRCLGSDRSEGPLAPAWTFQTSHADYSTFSIGVARFWLVARNLNSVWVERDR